MTVSFFSAFMAVKILQPLAFWTRLVDRPGGRKKHIGVVPLVGGLGIYASVCITALLFIEQSLFIRLFLLAGGFIVFIGLVDDRYHLSARVRLIGQLLVCCIFVFGLGLHIETFGNLFGAGQLVVGWLGYPLAILSLMGAINAFNMLDGIDGLVGSAAMISFVGLVALFGASGNADLELLCMAFIGATGAFLIFNIWGKPTRKRLKKVFMGDAGSMFLGLSIGALLIKGSQEPIAAFHPITALWLVLLPMTDMFTIMYRRIRRGKSPMAPDRTHIHHILLRAGFSTKQTLHIVIGVQTVFVLLGVVTVTQGFPEPLSFLWAVVFVTFYQLLLKRSWRFIRWTKRRLNKASYA